MLTPQQYHKAASISEKARLVYILSFGGGVGGQNLQLAAKSKLEEKYMLMDGCYLVNWQVYNTTKHFLIGVVKTAEVHADVVCIDAEKAKNFLKKNVNQINPDPYVSGDYKTYTIGDTIVFNHPEGKVLKGIIYSNMKNDKYLIKYNPDPIKAKIRYIYVLKNNVYLPNKLE